MRLLALDTSGAACSAALACDGTIEQRLTIAPRRHAELLLPMLDDLLNAAGLTLADLDALAYGQGPGSFTGVRIAAAVAQGAAFGAGLPVVGVSTLAALAQGGYRRHGARWLLPALDARMGEVYWGAYRVDAAGLAQALTPNLVAAPDQVPVLEAGEEARGMPGTADGWYGLGSGWETYPAELAARVGLGSGPGYRSRSGLVGIEADACCEAWDIAVLATAAFAAGAGRPPQDALPVYLRDRVAVPTRERLGR